jgi:S-adenosylmethionine:tRNA ribosyltransferase-isomerase
LNLAPLTRFDLADGLTAAGPAEQRGLARDEVRLLVATEQGMSHARFRDLPAFLRPGDLVVVNNSATVAGEVDAVHRSRGPVVVHVSTRLDDGTWVVELRTAPDAARPVLDATPADELQLPGAGRISLLTPYPRPDSSPTGRGTRLWRAAVSGPRTLDQHLLRHGRPIAYGYLDRRYPLAAYQTVFASRPGSAEMPSAARPFSHEVVSRLVARGIGMAVVTLHTGVSSQEAGEAPLPERFEVSSMTARLVNATRAEGGRVIAVGTTVTRALESAVRPPGTVVATRGWTERVISREQPPAVVDGLVTGWHDAQASHLLLVEAVAGADLTARAYREASSHGYLWHEFGDAALLIP